MRRSVLITFTALGSLAGLGCASGPGQSGYPEAGFTQTPAAVASQDVGVPHTPPAEATPGSAPVEPARTAPSKVSTAPPPSGSLTFGAPTSIALEAFSSQGLWFAHCQGKPGPDGRPVDVHLDARGNAIEPTVVTLELNGTSRTIDAVLAQDTGGRFLLVLVDGKAELIDSAEQRSFSLETLLPDLEFDESWPHRSFAFFGRDRYLGVAKKSAEGGTVTVMDLSTEEPLKTAHEVNVHAPIYRLQGEEHFLSVTTGAWPTRATRPEARCRMGELDSPIQLSGPHSPHGLTTQLVRPPHGSSKTYDVEEAPEYLMAFDRGWVRRTDEGRLLLVSNKVQRQIASARCGGRILGAETQSGYFLVSCEEFQPKPKPKPKSSRKKRTAPRYRFDVYLLRPGTVKDLSSDIMRTGVDLPPLKEPRLLPFRPGSDVALVDFSERALWRLSSGDHVLATTQSQALVRNGDHLAVVTKANRLPLDVRLPKLSPIMNEGGAAAFAQTLVRLEQNGAHIVQLPGRPVAITSSGHAIVSSTTEGSSRWAQGPLVWAPYRGPAVTAPAVTTPAVTAPAVTPGEHGPAADEPPPPPKP